MKPAFVSWTTAVAFLAGFFATRALKWLTQTHNLSNSWHDIYAEVRSCREYAITNAQRGLLAPLVPLPKEILEREIRRLSYDEKLNQEEMRAIDQYIDAVRQINESLRSAETFLASGNESDAKKQFQRMRMQVESAFYGEGGYGERGNRYQPVLDIIDKRCR